MKNRFLITFSILFLLFSVNCSKSDEGSGIDSYLIFGHSYGECKGDLCIEIFKLTKSQIFEDVADNFFKGNIKYELLSDEKFKIASDLFEFYPKDLLTETSRTFGCPDCMDQGAIILQFYDGKHALQRFVIDQDKKAIPTYLHSYIDRINEKIRLLN